MKFQASFVFACLSSASLAAGWWQSAYLWPSVALSGFALVASGAQAWLSAREERVAKSTTLRLEALEQRTEALQKAVSLSRLGG